MSKDSLDPMPRDLQALIGSAGPPVSPPQGAEERIAARLGAILGPPLTRTEGPASPRTGALARTGWLAGKPLIAATIGLVCGGGLGAGITARILARPVVTLTATPPVAAAHDAPVTAAAVSVPPAEPSPATSASRVPIPRAPASRPASPAATHPDTLAEERALLEAARTSLAQNDSDAALLALDQHAGEFPDGVLVEERESLAVQALIAARRYDDARARAARFAARYPASIFLPVVNQALETIP